MTVPLVIVAATVGAVLGAIILYWIGTLLNEERLEKIFNHKMFKMLGTGAIFYGRCIPVIRSLISIPAGTARVKFSKFLIYTTTGSLIWNIILVSLGSYMGENWQVIVTIFEEYSLVITGIIVIALVYGSFKWYKNKIKAD